MIGDEPANTDYDPGTQRGWFKNLISYDMFYHVEHHLFPGVPQQHLPQLAERLDKVLPELTSRRVF